MFPLAGVPFADLEAYWDCNLVVTLSGEKGPLRTVNGHNSSMARLWL